MRGSRLATLASVFVLSIGTHVSAQRIPWIESMPQAQQLAKTHHRLLLIHFWSPDCPPCLKLERSVFNQPELIRAIGTNYVPLKVNVAVNPQLARQFRVDRWPTDVIVTADNREVYRGVSPLNHNKYIALLDQVAAHTRLGMPVAGSAFTARAAGPATSTPSRRSTFPVGNQTPMVSQNGQPAAAGNGPPPAPRATKTPQRQMIANRYAAPTTPRQPAVASSYAPAYGGQYAPPAANQPSRAPRQPQPNNPYATPSPVADGRSLAGQGTRPAMPSSQAAPWLGTTEQPPRRGLQQPSMPAPPSMNQPAAPSLGLEGYCPVTLVEKEKWVKGDPKWGALHRGRTYLFASQEQQQRFLAEFDKYAPVLSGYDPVKFVEQGVLVDGKRVHGVFYHDQIYLFADEASLQQFWNGPRRYAPAALAERQQLATSVR